MRNLKGYPDPELAYVVAILSTKGRAVLRNRRNLFVAGLAALVAFSSPLPAMAAKKDAQGQRMLKAFNQWVTAWGVQNASFAAMRDGKIIAQGRAGDQAPGQPEPVASLTKAVTGVCIAKMVEAKKLKYGATLGKLIPGYFKANKPIDPRVKSITVGQLLTHESGIVYDPSQGTAEFAALDFRKKNLAPQLDLTFQRFIADKTYFYNNMNFVALGLVIEAVTKKPYETYCNDTVLEPAGVSDAVLNPPFKVMSSYGGWKLSAVDYARFLEHFRPAAKLMKSKPPSWPKFDGGNGVSYSIGTLLRSSQSSYNFWHAGDWRWIDAAEPGRNADFGAYFAMWFQNTHFVVTFAPQPQNGAVGDIDARMYQAAFPSGAASAAAARSAAPSGGVAGAEIGSDRGQSFSAAHD